MISPRTIDSNELDESSGRSISREDLNNLPIRSYEGPIRVVNDRSELEACIKEISKECILGFDTETRPAFERGVSYPPALLQLATASQVYIFQFQALGGLGAIRDIFQNADIIKAGVALSDDIKQLNDCWNFKPRNFVEIGTMAKELGFKQTGLRSLAGLLLGFRISKREQRSNWARVNLSRSQIIYAATDAWVSRELYLHLMTQWGDRPLPVQVDPTVADANRDSRRSEKKSRKRPHHQTNPALTPELPGIAWPDTIAEQAIA